MNKFLFDDLTIHHTISKKIKHSYISIKEDLQVHLKTPNVSKEYINNLLQSKRNWIFKQLRKAEINAPHKLVLEDEVVLFGEVYSVDSSEATLLRKKLEKLKINSKEKVIKAYNSFYKEYANNYITQRVEKFATIMGYTYSEIKYRKMKSRWGSCSSAKVLTFNTELIKVKKELIDYVVVHELAHLKYMNHSKEFHALVDTYLKDSKTYKNELKITKIATY